VDEWAVVRTAPAREVSGFERMQETGMLDVPMFSRALYSHFHAFQTELSSRNHRRVSKNCLRVYTQNASYAINYIRQARRNLSLILHLGREKKDVPSMRKK